MSTSGAVKPSIAVVVSSLFVLAGCVVCVSAGIAAVATAWDPCALLGGILFITLPGALGIEQYRGTFRRNGRAALTSTVSLFGIGGLAILAFSLTLAEMLGQGVQPAWTSLLLTMLAVGAAGFVCGWLNLRWVRRLHAVSALVETTAHPPQFALRELFAGVALVACTAALVVHFIRSTPPRYAEHVTRDQTPFGLPVDARDISFCRGIRGTIAYEFTIDEDGFRQWVASGVGSAESAAAHVPLEPITKPFEIKRYYFLASDLDGPGRITVTNGLSHHWSEEDRGVYAAFDRTTQRAYYFAHFH